MRLVKKTDTAKTQAGNALFLILIAVALFAALSYAVTQSDRSGGGITKENDVLLAARLTQQGAAVATAVQRLLLTGTSVATLRLCSVGSQCLTKSGVPALRTCSNGDNCVFSTTGGGVTVPAPPHLSLSGYSNGGWQFFEVSEGNSIQDIGTSAADSFMETSGSAQSISQALCEAINRKLGLSVPVAVDNDGDSIREAYPGEPHACFRGALSNYVYYHALVEN